MPYSDEDRAFLRETLPKSAHKRIDQILDHYAPTEVVAVKVRGSRIAVEYVDAYGLHLGVDANGNAVEVHFPHGADVTEVLA